LEGAAAVAIDLQAPELKLEEDRDGKKKKNRCGSCNKKVGLTGTFLTLVISGAHLFLPQ